MLEKIKTKLNIKNILKIIIIFFAIIGFLFVFVFFAMKFGLTKANSSIDNQSEYFKKLQKTPQADYSQLPYKREQNADINIYLEKAKIANQNWNEIKSLEEWNAIKIGLIKDYNLIEKVSKETGISKRLLITPLVVEQLRLMTSQREIFKRYFGPLAILGTQTQFSLGIYGMKENTAKQVEINLKEKNSPFYLGKKFENILDYNLAETNIDAERIKRLTNEKDHYYSYLYAAIYLKQILNQWKSPQPPEGGQTQKSFDISNRPEILMTIYNLGFEKSIPKESPEVGGAEIELNGKKYTFGSLAFYFYYSEEMGDVFN